MVDQKTLLFKLLYLLMYGEKKIKAYLIVFPGLSWFMTSQARM